VNPTISAWVKRDIDKLSAARRETLQKFLDELRRNKSSEGTIRGYIRAVVTLGNDGKPYEKLNETDVIAWMEKIGFNGWGNETINLFRIEVKHFLRWCNGCRSPTDPTPQFLKGIRRIPRKQELPRYVLSRSEVKQLIDACKDQRDRCLVYLGYESGTRASELLGLKVGDVEFNEVGAVIKVSGKTGARKLLMIESVPDLKLWLSMHPDRQNLEASLWPRRTHKKTGSLGPIGLTYLLENLRKEAGIEKHIHPHLLRHTRATHLAKVLKEAQLRIFFGWSKHSRMPEFYVHLADQDVDETLLRHYGIKVEAQKKDLLEPQTCPWCKATNSPSARFCQQCNAPLDPASASKALEKQRRQMEFVDDFLKWLQQRNPEIADDYFKEKRRELEGLAAE
jgi:integrase/recombinase XerD